MSSAAQAPRPARSLAAGVVAAPLGPPAFGFAQGAFDHRGQRADHWALHIGLLTGPRWASWAAARRCSLSSAYRRP